MVLVIVTAVLRYFFSACEPVSHKVCPSCIGAVVITALITAILATVVFSAVQIALCECHPRYRPRGTEIGASAGISYACRRGDEGGVIMKENHRITSHN